VPGTDQTFTFTADPGYLLDEVLVDGVNDPSAVTSGSLTFSGVNEDHQIIASFVTPPSDPYQTWAGGFFSEGDPDAAKSADPDHDGVKNLLEFAFGTDPNLPSSGPINYTAGGSGSIIQRGQPVLAPNTLHPPYFSAVFGRRWDELAAGLAYTVQFSADLDHWVDVAPSTEPQDPYDSEIEVVEVAFPAIITIDAGSGPFEVVPQFFRVLVTDVEP
jgi:hypothetical protein